MFMPKDQRSQHSKKFGTLNKRAPLGSWSTRRRYTPKILKWSSLLNLNQNSQSTKCREKLI